MSLGGEGWYRQGRIGGSFCRRVFAESWGLIARVRYDALVAIGAAIGGDTTVTRLAESCGASTAKCG